MLSRNSSALLSCKGAYCPCFVVISAGISLFSISCCPAFGQIGGQNFDDGPFLIEDVEDRDLVADPLGRDWVPDFNGNKPILSAVDLAESTLTLHADQSPVGAFTAGPRAKFGFINQGFGVPIPSQVGESTLDFPGDITSFPAWNFLACYEQQGLSDPSFLILLECYPENGDGTFPTVVWSYTPSEGTTFQPVSVDLFSPSSILNNENSLAVSELLSQTRFVFFFFSATVVGADAGLEFHIDDIELGADQGPSGVMAVVENWDTYK